METGSSRTLHNLHEIRAELLDQINRIHNSDSSIKKRNYTDLDLLEREYNGIMDQIRALSESPLSDPLEELPEEIWENIIQESVRQYFDYATRIISIEELLLLTLVSTGWRMAIINNPRFWTDITLSDTVADLEIKIFLSIQLSKDLPLSICLGHAGMWERFGHWMVTHNTRIRSLSVITNDLMDINSFGNLPLLQSFHLNSWQDRDMDWFEIIRTAESIHGITGLNASLRVLQCKSLDQIRTLEVEGRTEEFMPHLERLVYLRCVQISSITEGDGQNPKLFKGAPLLWSNLSIRGIPGICIEPLLLRVTSTLSELELAVSWSDVRMTLLRCSAMPQLRLLVLAINPMVKPFNRVSLSASTIDTLRLNFVGEQNNEEHQKNIENLFATFTSWAPNVRNLTLGFPNRSHKSVFDYACSLKQLASVELTCFRAPGGIIESEKSYGVLNTQHLVPCCNEHLKLLRPDGVVNLELRYNTTGLNSSQWKSLHTLTISDFPMGWEGVSLPCVTSIIFQETSYTDTAPNFTSLCQEIAIHPDIFPSLEYLATLEPPEWDILFLMLERRNILSNTMVARIKTVQLYSIPSLTILEPLTELLGGRLTVRPSNFEVSLAGMVESCFDPNM